MMTSDGQRGAAVSGDAPAPTAGQAPTPKLRALLLCDLAIETLGDPADQEQATARVREHDHLVRELLAAHGGFEADKTDGFLALFERPIHAVAFALAYQRRLRAQGKGVAGRVGIHVGDVVTWANNTEDVEQGARRVEVEGLAKPVTARLMHLAQPGQILLSSIAMALAQRAESELDPAPGGVRWQHHGPYRFKGVPAPMVVHEVGEPGVAPLKPPPSDDKAVRDTPWWRRPAALVAETLAVLAVVVALFLLSGRPQPAIAFVERDWVVVGDLRNLTADPGLTEALDVAFRISLEQSRHVNVLSDLKVRDTLGRMQRAPGTPLDRETGAEIALREGARALILPTVAEVGGRVRVSAEVVDPNTLTTVYAESQDGIGLESALRSIDLVTGALRVRLGEALRSIERDSAPLPQVSTASMDALKAFAEGISAYERRDFVNARHQFNQAIELDNGFALAHVGLARVAVALHDSELAHSHLREAIRYRANLPTRDQLYLDAWLATLESTSEALAGWRVLSDLYPDLFAGSYNFALSAWHGGVELEEALSLLARSDTQQNALRSATHYLLGTINLNLDRLDAAGAWFERAMAEGSVHTPVYYAQWLATQRRFPEALAAIHGQALSDSPGPMIAVGMLHVSMAADRGHLAEAAALAREMQTSLRMAGPVQGRIVATVVLSAAFLHEGSAGVRDTLGSTLEAWVRSLPDSPRDTRRHAAYSALALAYLAVISGDRDSASRTVAAVSKFASPEHQPELAALLAVVEGQILLASGEPENALRRLAASGSSGDAYLARAVSMEAHTALGNHDRALAKADWLATHRGRAYAEWGSFHMLQPINVAMSNLARLRAAEIAAASARPEIAREQMARFIAQWPEAASIEALRGRIERIEEAVQASSL